MNFHRAVLTQDTRNAFLASRLQRLTAIFVALSIAGAGFLPTALADWRRLSNNAIELKFLGRYSSGVFGPDAAGAESLAHDPRAQRLFVVNVANRAIDVLDIKKPTEPTFLFAIDLTPFGANANSVAVHNGVVAAAVQANTKTDPGMAVFFAAHGGFLNAVQVGALPDTIVFTPDGKRVLVANEGEPRIINRTRSILRAASASSTFPGASAESRKATSRQRTSGNSTTFRSIRASESSVPTPSPDLTLNAVDSPS